MNILITLNLEKYAKQTATTCAMLFLAKLSPRRDIIVNIMVKKPIEIKKYLENTIKKIFKYIVFIQ